MPLGKYYCDYCEKEFQDTPYARKKHIQGSHHQQSKALWYRSFSDPTSVPGLARGVCHRFIRTGFCQYGDACRYSHPKPNIPNPVPSVPGVNFMGGVQAPVRLVNQSLSGEAIRDHTGVSWGNLPPSLRPPPEGGYPPLPFIDWG
ncbi:Zinc finger CCCH domain-containing protein 3 [Acorus calamus]|uniref:Zinc finger CCCH domain-containing protein 3 n=1 Tax=Acorus calamus TaxID=4465 RepID=A0AAV9F023_ACOCL|nr:Zinc finger CCCH domain-containing protein 3 [Acorus calamus]